MVQDQPGYGVFTMNIKGTAYLTRKDTIIKNFGEEKWQAFSAKLAARESYFNQMIMNVTLIPLDKFVIFLDEVLKEFFDNDEKHYWTLGEKSADFSLAAGGPYHSFVMTRNLKQFVESMMPRVWSTYFDGGVFTARLEKNTVHITISNMPTRHIYFEYLIMGYIRQMLIIFGKKSVERRIRGFSAGHDDVYYQFELQ